MSILFGGKTINTDCYFCKVLRDQTGPSFLCKYKNNDYYDPIIDCTGCDYYLSPKKLDEIVSNYFKVEK